jgi:hypothetical protein
VGRGGQLGRAALAAGARRTGERKRHGARRGEARRAARALTQGPRGAWWGVAGAGAAVAVKGTVVESPAKGQKYELKASQVQLVGDCRSASRPPCLSRLPASPLLQRAPASRTSLALSLA